CVGRAARHRRAPDRRSDRAPRGRRVYAVPMGTCDGGHPQHPASAVQADGAMTARPTSSASSAASASRNDDTAPTRHWSTHAVVGSAIIAAFGYLAFVLWSGWSDVARAVARVGTAGVTLALCLSLVNYALRFTRWQRYLAALDQRIPWRDSLRIYIAGFALT